MTSSTCCTLYKRSENSLSSTMPSLLTSKLWNSLAFQLPAPSAGSARNVLASIRSIRPFYIIESYMLNIIKSSYKEWNGQDLTTKKQQLSLTLSVSISANWSLAACTWSGTIRLRSNWQPPLQLQQNMLQRPTPAHRLATWCCSLNEL